MSRAVRSQTMVRSISFIAAFIALALLSSSCTPQSDTGETKPASDARPRPVDAGVEPKFRESASALGIDFVHFNGMSGEYYFCETVGPGCALFDYDGDGDLDLYVLQGAMLGPGKSVDEALFPPPSGKLRDRLYRNELLQPGSSEKGELRFTDVTEEAGLDMTGYGMGVAAADYDNDGDVDLYVTNYGPNHLLRNEGDGTFRDVTAESGTGDERWSTSAAFVDYDRDGLLDLFVCSYVDFTFANHKECYSVTSRLDYCGPLSYDATPDRLLRNRGDGTFQDVSADSQIARQYGGALGVVCSDFNADGWVDIYVANDGLPNQLWLNEKGTFRNIALLAGCAYNANGAAESSMGIDAADFDGDGDDDLFMTHLATETNTLYVNDGRGLFHDETAKFRLAAPSRPLTGFGTAWFDFDGDGALDLFSANGAVTTIEALARAGDPFPLRQRNQLFRNRGASGFVEVAMEGLDGDRPEVSRGAAFGDIDNDGDCDIVVGNNNAALDVLINETPRAGAWLGLRIVDTPRRRDALGARVEVVCSDGESLWRTVRAAASYCSANDPRVLVGLGSRTATKVRVHWPEGGTEVFPAPAVGGWHELRRGSGRASP